MHKSKTELRAADFHPSDLYEKVVFFFTEYEKDKNNNWYRRFGFSIGIFKTKWKLPKEISEMRNTTPQSENENTFLFEPTSLFEILKNLKDSYLVEENEIKRLTVLKRMFLEIYDMSNYFLGSDPDLSNAIYQFNYPLFDVKLEIDDREGLGGPLIREDLTKIITNHFNKLIEKVKRGNIDSDLTLADTNQTSMRHRRNATSNDNNENLPSYSF